MIQEFDPERPELGWQPGVPEPFYKRPWWRLFRLTAYCMWCDRPYGTREAYRLHYRLRHLSGDKHA